MKISKTWRVSKKRCMELLFCFILLIPFFEPRGIWEIFDARGGFGGRINTLFFYGRIAVIVGMAALVICAKKLPSKISLCVFVYYFYMLTVCIIKQVDKSEAFNNLIFAVGILLILEFYLYRNISVFITVFVWLNGMVVLLNILTVFLFPYGMYENTRGDTGNWLLGYYNAHFFTVLPWLALFLLCSLRKNGKLKWKTVLVPAICIAAIYFAGSKTSSIALLIFFVALILTLKIGKITMPNIGIIIAGSIFLSYLLIMFRIQEYFANFIQTVLHRDASLTGRTVIWTTAISAFVKSPLIGNGVVVYYPSIFSDWSTTQAHNTFLNILVNGGVIGAGIFLLIFILVIRKVAKIQQHPYKKLFTVVMLAYGISFFTEMFQLPHMLATILFFAYHMDILIKAMPVRQIKQTVFKIGNVTIYL